MRPGLFGSGQCDSEPVFIRTQVAPVAILDPDRPLKHAIHFCLQRQKSIIK